MVFLLIRRRILESLGQKKRKRELESIGRVQDTGEKSGNASPVRATSVIGRFGVRTAAAELLGYQNSRSMAAANVAEASTEAVISPGEPTVMGEHERVYEMGSSVMADMSAFRGTDLGQSRVAGLDGQTIAAMPGNNITNLAQYPVTAFNGHTEGQTAGNNNVTNMGQSTVLGFAGRTEGETAGNNNVTNLAQYPVASFNGLTEGETAGNNNVTNMGQGGILPTRAVSNELHPAAEPVAPFQTSPVPLIRTAEAFAPDPARAMTVEPFELTAEYGFYRDDTGALETAESFTIGVSDSLDFETERAKWWAEQDGDELHVMRTWDAEQNGETLLLDSCRSFASEAVVEGSYITLYWQQEEDDMVGILWGDGSSEQTAPSQESTSSGKIYATLSHSYGSEGAHTIRLYVKNRKLTWNPGNGDVAGKPCGFLGGYKIDKKHDEKTPEITSFSFGEGANLAQYAFYGCGSEEVDNVQSGGLSSVDLNGASAVPQYAFYGCTALAELFGTENLREVEQHGFNGCRLTSLPTTLEAVGDYGFYGNPMTGQLPEGLTRIGQYAFSSCRFVEIAVGSLVEKVGSSAFNNNSYLVNVEYAAKNMPNSCFAGCGKMENVWIRSNCEVITASSELSTPFDFPYNNKVHIYCEPASIRSHWDKWFNYCYRYVGPADNQTKEAVMIPTTWNVEEKPW